MPVSTWDAPSGISGAIRARSTPCRKSARPSPSERRTGLPYLEDMINLFEPGAEVCPGVEAVDTSGHTPGHMSFMLHGGSDPVLIAGDAILHFAVSFAHPLAQRV
jgi:glyoxylase-like metal-dependent hydrolase (beta-lactamase superfamily II)